MPPRKRKLEDDDTAEESPKYVAGKVVRNGTNPPIEYSDPFRPDSELFRDEWSIPRFNAFVTFTLDHLREVYPTIFKDFIKLPSRKFHPQYYYKIDQPISINEIKNRDYEYADGTRDFLLDVELLAKNCASYNEEDSLIVKNALQMVNYIEYEALKAKNVEKNYMINGSVKDKLLALFEKIEKATAKKITDSVTDLKANLQDADDDEFLLAEPFMELVDKEELPEYYEVIHRPTALNIIKRNLIEEQYPKIYDFITEMHLVFDNAFVFNSASSLIYQSAQALLEYFITSYREMLNELKELKDHGEIVLDVQPNEYEKNLGHRKVDEKTATVNEESDDDFDDFNHVEGLGNGYQRNILTEDYLLGPEHIVSMKLKADETNKIPIITEKINKRLETPKYNILKSLKKDSVSDQFKTDKELYTLIAEVSIFTSKGLYIQGINPMQGTKPSCNQNWLEYNFIGSKMNQNENIFSLSLDPTQTYLTVIAKVKNSKLRSILHLNNDLIRPRNEPRVVLPIPNINNNGTPDIQTQDDNRENQSDNETHNEKFDIHLNEGLNLLEFECRAAGDSTESIDNKDTVETMKFWINVFP